MRMSRLMESSLGEFESRKRVLQRQEMGQVYRKNAQYQSSKNPLLKILENVLSEKAEKGPHAVDQVGRERGPSELDGIQTKEVSTWEEVENSVKKSWDPGWILVEHVRNDQRQVLSQKEEHFSELDDQANIPERFIGRFAERDASHETLLSGSRIESRAYERLFQLASTNYLNHIAMVKNDYRSFGESTFSRTA